jgi:hypothetical protein
MNDPIIKTSRINNSEGGDITPSGGFLTGDRLDFSISSEESFFSTDIYKGLYIQNTSPEYEVRNVTLTVLGGTGRTTDIEDDLNSFFKHDAIDEEVQMIDRSSSGLIIEPTDLALYNPDSLTFYDFLYGRKLKGQPPYNPTIDELDDLNVQYPDRDTLTQRYGFESLKAWFRQQIILTSPTRTSLFGQLNVELYTPAYRILDAVDETTPLLNFQKKISIPYLKAYDGTNKAYWGFYLKIETDFVPDWELQTDFSTILITWNDYNTITGVSKARSKLFKLTVQGNLKDINSFNLRQVDYLYNFYPPYFRNYEDDIDGG